MAELPKTFYEGLYAYRSASDRMRPTILRRSILPNIENEGQLERALGAYHASGHLPDEASLQDLLYLFKRFPLTYQGAFRAFDEWERMGHSLTARLYFLKSVRLAREANATGELLKKIEKLEGRQRRRRDDLRALVSQMPKAEFSAMVRKIQRRK